MIAEPPENQELHKKMTSTQEKSILDRKFGLKYPIRNVKNNLHYFRGLLKSSYLSRVYGMNIGSNTRISGSAKLDKTNPKGVHIGSNTAISFGVSILTHDFVNGAHVDTFIGDNCFVGGNSIIHPGVRIGNSCIIGAGSVVMNDIPSNTIAAGNPARLIRGGIQTSEYGVLNKDTPKQASLHAVMNAPSKSQPGANREVIDFIKKETGVDDALLDIDIADTNVDSFALITLRTALEVHFNVSIPDLEWVSARSLSEIPNLPSFKRKAAPEVTEFKTPIPAAEFLNETKTTETSAIDPPPPPPSIPKDRFTDVTHKLLPGTPASMVDHRETGRIHRRHIIEMSKMALSGLSEPWLFRELNDLHWALICDFLQTPSSQISDGRGDRLYATFTRCKIDFPSSLCSFNENAPLDITSRLERYGSSVFFSKHAFTSSSDATGDVTMMSTFAKYGERGNNKSLVKGAPEIPDPDAVPSMKEILDFGLEYRVRRSELNHETIIFETEYEILGPHDINGVGLLYFAAYPTIFDCCLEKAEGKGFLRAFSSVSKDIMYFANSEPDETLIFRLHERTEPESGLVQHVCSLTRKSDGVRMAEMIGVKRQINS